MTDIKWTPVWTDEKLLKVVINSNLTALKKIRDDINKGEVTLKIPFLEYKTGTLAETETLPFTKENELAKILEVLERKEVLNKIRREKDFVPFVVNLEAAFHMMIDPAKLVRGEIDYLLGISKISETYKAELEKIKKYSDFDLRNEFQKGMYNPPPNNRSKVNMWKYRNLLKGDYPEIGNMIADAVLSAKPTTISRFNGKDYLTYFVGDEMDEFGAFHAYLPIESADDLPNSNSFKARIIGVMFFNANPPQKGLSRLTLIAVSLFMPWI